jgi:hypothetical protein
MFQKKWMPKWAKERVVENLRRQVNWEIEKLQNDIRYKRNLSESITSKVNELLVESLEKVRV